MWPNPQFSADFVIFTEEMLNGKLHFLYSDHEYLTGSKQYMIGKKNYWYHKVCWIKPNCERKLTIKD